MDIICTAEIMDIVICTAVILDIVICTAEIMDIVICTAVIMDIVICTTILLHYSAWIFLPDIHHHHHHLFLKRPFFHAKLGLDVCPKSSPSTYP